VEIDPAAERTKECQEKLPVCPKLEAGEIRRIKNHMEERYKIDLSGVEIKYSDNIQHAFCVPAVNLPSQKRISKSVFLQEKINRFYRTRKSELRLLGLDDDELKEISPSEFTFFLPRRYPNCLTGLYGALWHEFGHVVASVLGVKAKIPNESVAIAYSFRGLLQEAKEGKITLEKAVDQIRRYIGMTEDPLARAFKHYKEALFTIRKHNPDLKFSNRDVDELLFELDETIDYTLKYPFAYQEGKLRYEKLFVSGVALIAAILFIISLIL